MSETKQRITREVIVKDYEYMDGGKNARKEIIAVYASPTNRSVLAYNAEVKKRTDADPDAKIAFSEFLIIRFDLQELRNVDTEKERGKLLYTISLDNLEDETNHNLTQIVRAIEDDISPKSQPAK